MKINWQVITLIIILLVGGAARFAGTGYGLPFTYRSDEPTLTTIALRMIRTGDLNPHWFAYPSLMFYLNAFALSIANVITRLEYPQVITMGVGHLETPALFLISRGLTALFGVGAILVTYLIGRRTHPFAGLVASALVAISPTAVATSQTVSPDEFALFFILLTFLGTLRVLDDPDWRNYLFAGISAGLAVSAKYNAAVIVLPLVVAHFWRFGIRGIACKEIWLAGIASTFAFLLTTPYAVLDFNVFWQGSTLGPYQYAVEGHAGQEGNAFLWYVDYLRLFEGAYVVLAVVGMLVSVFKRERVSILALVFSFVYFAAVSQLRIRNDRTILLIIPFLALFAAQLVVRIGDWMARGRGWRVALIAASSLVLAVTPAQVTLAANERLTERDVRETARQWLEANLLPGSRVAQEAYTPYIDVRRFVVQGIDALVDHSPDWYVQNGFEYFVFSEAMYGRFFAEPNRYGIQIDKYNQFFLRFPEARRFNENNFEIRIYKTGATLPPHRVAARYGDYGEHVELIGYDDVQWAQGEPLRVRLYWRTLDEKPEPFEVELRLLGPDDQEIAKARSDLFQGKGWREGMFDGVWTIPTPTDMAPGSYRLQVNVVWTRYAYSMPAQSWSEKKIDPVILEPIEMQVRQ